VPKEVFIELQAGGLDCSEIRAIRSGKVLVVAEGTVELPVLLNSQLDKGEASVIQNAVVHGISVVAIDEKMGRRIARLHQLRITGSVGILIKAAQAKLIPRLEVCFDRMHAHGIWISRNLQEHALRVLEE
jgi:predicted nucleic acid-binding protein